jgi:hypothetical protein
MALLAVVIAAAGCKKNASSSASETSAPVAAAAADPDRAMAIADLQHDLATARAAMAAGRNPAYALDRMQVATRALSDERDDGVLKLLAEAETIYGLQAPVAYAESKLAAIEKSASPDGGASPRPEDCSAVRDMLNRVGGKFKERSDVQSIVARWKASCPKELRRGPRSDRGSSSYSSSSSSSSAAAAQRQGDCRRRCEDAGFHCRAGCPTGCTTDLTWDFCNQRNNSCRDGCEQNEKFCRVACGE